MKIVLYNAVSLDGFIATKDGNTDWVKDLDLWEADCKKFGCVILGRKTYEEVGDINGVLIATLTSHPQSHKSTDSAFFASSPQDLLTEFSRRGLKEVMLGGGAATNATFARAGLIDEIILDIHPILLGQGIKLLGDFSDKLELKLLNTKTYNGFVQHHYKIIK